MNVLFIGNWDPVGNGLANRLLREGHTVCWMTEEDQTILWNGRLQGNIYRGSFRMEELTYILKSQMIDTVVFLTASLRETMWETAEYESHIRILSSVLAGLRGYPVKSFVYLSSMELEYADHVTPMLSDLMAGELYCQTYSTDGNLPILVARLGYVYGNATSGQVGYIGRTLNEILKQNPIRSVFGPEEYVDTIHEEDAAMALYQLLILRKTGRYNLVSGHPVTMEQLFQCLGKAAGMEARVEWKNLYHTASAQRFQADEIKLQTGWIPFYLIQERGQEVLQRCAEQVRLEKAERERKQSRRHVLEPVIKRFAPGSFLRSGVETVLLFVVTQGILPFSQNVPDLKYVDVRALFVALTACFYGTEMGMLAAVLASGSYLYSLAVSYVDVSYLIYSVDTWIPFIAYIITGLVIGNHTNRRKETQKSQQNSYAQLEKKYAFLQAIQTETLEIKSKLQRQIARSRHSFGDIYRVVLELDSLRPERILLKVISILQNTLGCDQTAVFRLGGEQFRYARLMACSPILQEKVPKSLDLEDFPLLRDGMKAGELFVNTNLLPGYPDFAASIRCRGVLYGMVMVYNLESEKFTMYYQNLFKVLIGLVENNLIKALEYENTQREKNFISGTELLNPNAFAEQLAFMKSRQEGVSYPFTLAQVLPKSNMSLQTVSRKLYSLIRVSDYMGVDGEGTYWIILTNTAPEQLDGLKRRFEKQGLDVEAVLQ